VLLLTTNTCRGRGKQHNPSPLALNGPSTGKDDRTLGYICGLSGSGSEVALIRVLLYRFYFATRNTLENWMARFESQDSQDTSVGNQLIPMVNGVVL